MSKIAIVCLAFYLACPCLSAASDDSTAPPKIQARFFTPKDVEVTPILEPLKAVDRYHNKLVFKPLNFPQKQDILFEFKRTAGPKPNVYELFSQFAIQPDGTLLLANTQNSQNAIVVSSKGYLPGERVFFRFRTPDDSIQKETSTIPMPIEITDCHQKIALQAELVSYAPTVYSITLPTMQEGEDYSLKIVSLGDTTRAKPKFSGKSPILFNPEAKGKSIGGEAFLEIRRQSGEVIAAKFPWGSAFNDYLKGEKNYSASAPKN